MLSSPPPSHDEATLLACSLATEWGHKQIGQMQPDVEMVLSSVGGPVACRQCHNHKLLIPGRFWCLTDTSLVLQHSCHTLWF